MHINLGSAAILKFKHRDRNNIRERKYSFFIQEKSESKAWQLIVSETLQIKDF